jgi:hypothetical protein
MKIRLVLRRIMRRIVVEEREGRLKVKHRDLKTGGIVD